MICTRCGSTGREVEWSHAAGAMICLGCHLRLAPATEGTDAEVLDLAREVRRDADDLAAAGETLAMPRLGAIAAELAQIPLLLEVGSDRETPEQLRRAAESLRARAIRALGATR